MNRAVCNSKAAVKGEDRANILRGTHRQRKQVT